MYWKKSETTFSPCLGGKGEEEEEEEGWGWVHVHVPRLVIATLFLTNCEEKSHSCNTLFLTYFEDKSHSTTTICLSVVTWLFPSRSVFLPVRHQLVAGTVFV
jgi:hypothetical protein